MPTRPTAFAHLLVVALGVSLSACQPDVPTAAPAADAEDAVSGPSTPEPAAFVIPNAWMPGGGREQIPIWPSVPPDARPDDGPEVTGTGSKPVAGRPWIYADRVATPTITVYSPDEARSGAAVVVFPGGGYNVVAMDLEGTEACDWLTSIGVTCVLLKYRVPCETVRPYRDCPTAHQDAQRAVRLVRARSDEWGIDPGQIGVLGFSAGGHMVAALSVHFDRRLYPPVDAADGVSARPDFVMALYPGHLAIRSQGLGLNPDIQVTSRTPPTFMVHAYDDPVDPVENTLVYAAALRRAGVPVEMHVFATGGHAFGLRRTESPITAWPERAEDWLRATGVLGP